MERTMDFFELIESRHSVRAYLPDPVSEEYLGKILEAARLAPTAHNNQPFKIVVIRTNGREEELRRIYGRAWFSQAPLLLCVCGVLSEGWVRGYDRRSYLEVDAAIVMDHIILAATALGLGTCWIAAFNAPEAKAILGLPVDVEPLLFTPIGYSADTPKMRERKPLSDLVRYESW
jgi:nitroreductase